MHAILGTVAVCGLMLLPGDAAIACGDAVQGGMCMPVQAAHGKAVATTRPAKAGNSNTAGAETQKAAQDKDAPPALDMDALIERLKNTDAIGFFTKLAIRNDVMDFSAMVRRYRQQSMLKARIQDIRARFEGLFLKIVALLEKDPALSRDIYLARKNIWKRLVEEKA